MQSRTPPLPALALLLAAAGVASAAIDREALVRRHNVHTTAVDPEAAVSVGNGDFAFTIDVTGLQSLPERYREQGIPLETLGTWAWHSFPNPGGLTLNGAMKDYPFYGRTVRFPALQSSDAGAYFRQNPHPIPLGQIRLMLDDRPVAPADLSEIDQQLDLWTGIVRSRYRLQGEPVEVATAAHAHQSAVAVTIRSPLLEQGRLSVQWRFPFSYDTNTKNKPPMIWDRPDAHRTRAADAPEHQFRLERTTLDATYFVGIVAEGAGAFSEVEPHIWSLRPSGAPDLRFATAFAAKAGADCPDAAAVLRSSTQGWADYWTEGGAVELSRSTDPRAAELERRIVLSQYLMRVNYAGAFPPAETGLTQLSWYGKHNSEMYFWHAAHWYQWGHLQYLERGLDWYRSILPAGMAVAAEQGFQGVRWPKMSGIDGSPAPGTINPFIIWNQPNPIYLCELVYRAKPTPRTLEHYRDLVFASARFLASYAQPDPETGRYHLGPPIKAVTEDTNENQTRDPTFELAYWHYGLEVAQAWRRRLGLAPDPQWQQVLEHLSPLPVDDGKYLEIETFRDIYRDGKPDPNSMLMALGFLPRTAKVDPEVMRATFAAVTDSHPDGLGRWVSWAMGQAAMTCARLGDGESAVRILTNPAPKARFMPSGHVRRAKEPNGCVTYLPVNASLLTAVGLMTAGWDDAPDSPAPGFPQDGSWIVEWEGLNRMP